MGKKSKRHKMPPLSKRDRGLYILFLILGMGLILGLLLLLMEIRRSIGWADTAVLASSVSGSTALQFPFFTYVTISILVLWISAWEGRVPLLGNPKVQYGTQPWKKGVYPVFRKKPASLYIPPSHRRFRKSMMLLWLVGLLLTASLVPLSFFGRDCLRDDLHIVRYNCLNRQIQPEYSPVDYDTLELIAFYRHRFRGSDQCYLELLLTMNDGTQVSFYSSDFREHSQFPEAALALSQSCREVRVRGLENLPDILAQFPMDEAHSEMLYRLFGAASAPS